MSLGRFLRRHRRAEELTAEAVGVDLVWTILRRLLFGAAVAGAATFATTQLQHQARRPSYHLSVAGAAFLTRNEGVRYTPYNDPFNCTVGVGHLIHMGPCSASDYARWRLTPAQAQALLLHDSGWAAAAVSSGVSRRLSQPQADALIDLTFNIGAGGFLGSSLRGYVNAGDTAALRARWPSFYVTASGHYLSGLHSRRLAELHLYLTGDYGPGIGRYAPPPPNPQVYLGRGQVWPGRSVQVAKRIRPFVDRMLKALPNLRAYSGFRRSNGKEKELGDHRCGYAVDFVALQGATKAGLRTARNGAYWARTHHAAYVEPLRLTWRPGNHHLHVSVLRCR